MTVPGIGGPPLKFTPEEFENKIVAYFQYVDDVNKGRSLMDEKHKPYTLSGLCVYLGTTRETWREYGHREEFKEAIKQAKIRVENYVEEGSLNGSINVIGAIFNLKNNFGWVDKIEVNTNSQPEQLTPDDIKRKLMERNKDDG
jgi:hypothetical protein